MGKTNVQVGSKIVIVGAYLTEGKYSDGDLLNVKKVESDGRVYVVEHDRVIARQEYVVVGKQAKVGDKIKIVRTFLANGYKKGDILTVSEAGTNFVRAKGTSVISSSEYVIVEEAPKTQGTKRKAKVGEKIKIVKAELNGDRYKNGDVLTVKESLNAGVFVKEHGRGIYHNEYVVVEEPKETPKESSQYNEVSRRAKAGDKIKVVDAKVTAGKYKNGDTLTVAQSTSGGVFVEDFTIGLYHSEYVVLEPKKSVSISVERKVDRKAKVGETIEIVNPNMTSGEYEEGSRLVVKSVGGGWLYAHGVDIVILDNEYAVIEKTPIGGTIDTTTLDASHITASAIDFRSNREKELEARVAELETELAKSESKVTIAIESLDEVAKKAREARAKSFDAYMSAPMGNDSEANTTNSLCKRVESQINVLREELRG